MSRINTIVFDYDGTLHDTSVIYILAFQKAYDALVHDGYAVPREFEDKEITKWLGYTAADMWNTFMPELPDEIKQRSSLTVRSAMAELIREGRSRLYDGTREVLAHLKAEGRHTVILSNCMVSYMDAHRAHFHLDELFDGFFCAEAYGFVPKHEIFRSVMERFGGAYCMVGDRYNDIEAGSKNGAFTVGCVYGFGSAHELDGARRVIGSINELPSVINELELKL